MKLLRISSHKLLIETGRYDNIPRNERVSNVCNCKTIEDEIPFLLHCPSYSSLRDMFFTKIEPSIPFPRLLAKETLLSHIMNSTDYFINTQLTSFVSSCFELACEQAPKWGIGRRQKSSSERGREREGGSFLSFSPPYRAIFLFALYPTWEPVHRLASN